MNHVEKRLSNCRICRSERLESILDFDQIALTGVFLIDGSDVPKASLNLGRCMACGLVQLLHSYPAEMLYGESYGYESHLNSSMVKHLKQKARTLERRFLTIEKPVIVDIASNDGTLLSGYENKLANLVGVDPLISNLSDFYPNNAVKIPLFFSAEEYFKKVDKKANLVTSLSVLYDLEDPVDFARNIWEILEPGGYWHLEQSYLPTMCETLSYDTVCHEHLLYLSLHDIIKILDSSGFQILDASLNSVNGGSIAVTAIKSEELVQRDAFVDYLLLREKESGIVSGKKLKKFAEDSQIHRNELRSLLKDYKDNGFTIIGLGASTKGNVLLQWCEIDSKVLKEIGDINPKKFGKQTPGSAIPIVSEKDALISSGFKTIALVLPWHFRAGIEANCAEYLERGGKLLFPLPQIQAVTA